MSNLKPQTAWTDQEEATLRRMTAAHATAGQMAAALGNGRTRNAVIGKVGRMGLKLSSGETSGNSSQRKARLGAKAQALQAERPAKIVRPAPAPVPAPSPAPPVAHKPPRPIAVDVREGVSILALGAAMCRATVGRALGAEQQFCGAATPRVPRGSRSGIAGFETYCDDCRRGLSKAVTPRSRTAAR